MVGDAASAGWVEPHGGRVVPVYAVTGGRTRANDGPDMPIEALVTTDTLRGWQEREAYARQLALRE